MIGFTGRARDGSKYDPALRLPRTGSDSGSGVFFLLRKGTKRFEDKALYTVKERTHSAEGGGHERRKSRGEQRM